MKVTQKDADRSKRSTAVLRSKHEVSQMSKPTVQDLDAVTVALKHHFGKMSAEDMKMSHLLQGQLQTKSHANLSKKTREIEAKISLAKEVTLQKVIVNTRKAEFRISKARLTKKTIDEGKQKTVEDAFNRKNRKILNEQDQNLERIKRFESWQVQWLNFLNMWVLIEKVASIRRASELF